MTETVLVAIITGLVAVVSGVGATWVTSWYNNKRTRVTLELQGKHDLRRAWVDLKIKTLRDVYDKELTSVEAVRTAAGTLAASLRVASASDKMAHRPKQGDLQDESNTALVTLTAAGPMLPGYYRDAIREVVPEVEEGIRNILYVYGTVDEAHVDAPKQLREAAVSLESAIGKAHERWLKDWESRNAEYARIPSGDC